MSRSAMVALYGQWRQIAAMHARRVRRARRILAEAHAVLARARAADLAAQRALSAHRAARERIALACLSEDGGAEFAREALRANLRDEATPRRERDAARLELAKATEGVATSRGLAFRAEKRHENAVGELDKLVCRIAEEGEEEWC